MRTIGYGIIGCGMISEIHAKALAEIEGAKLIAGFDPVPGRAKAFGEKFGCLGYENFDEFLANEDIEAVTIATPSGLHLDGALGAIKAGKNVIVEKPIEITLERVDQIIKAAEEKDVVIIPARPTSFIATRHPAIKTDP